MGSIAGHHAGPAGQVTPSTSLTVLPDSPATELASDTECGQPGSFVAASNSHCPSSAAGSSDAGCGASAAASSSSRRYPVSFDGSCPYCASWNVQYLVLPHALRRPDAATTVAMAASSQVGNTAAVEEDRAATAGEVGGWQPISTVTSSISPESAARSVDAESADEEESLPDVVLKLLELKRAARVTVTDECPEPSSFRCIDCSYVVPAPSRTRLLSC